MSLFQTRVSRTLPRMQPEMHVQVTFDVLSQGICGKTTEIIEIYI